MSGNGQGDLPFEERPATPAISSHRDVIDGHGELKTLINDNFILYASYVITDRAIPDLADGLKPVQRRILWALKEKDDGKFIKVANVVGHSMQYHPHGDASIADALVNLANKNYLIEGQGNFGNILTGDNAAASRYIECRLTEMARKELFNDHLTKFVPSYDGRNKEPVTLPAKIPLLLMLGADGIAVGLATRILPHNFVELIEAQIAVLEGKNCPVLVPDFPQGGIMDAAEYDQGRGKVSLRADIVIKGTHLVIREVPYGTTTESLINSIENAAKAKKIKVRAIDDFTAEQVEIHVKPSPGEDAEKTLQALYHFTDCEASVNSSIIVIHNGRPAKLTVEEIIRANNEALVKILKKELEWDRRRLQDEFHAKSLAQIFIENRIYKDIEEEKSYEAVQQAVLDGVNQFRDRLERDVTKEDVEKLLALQIKRISRFDINKNREEIEKIVSDLADVEKNLKNLTVHAKRYLKKLIKTYGGDYPRRTRIEQGAFEKVEARELTATELKHGYDRESGYFGHVVKGTDPFQGEGNEKVDHLECSSLEELLLVWKDGRYRKVKPPEKLFVGKDLLFVAIYDRKRVYTAVYKSGPITYFKRFTFGGSILDKDYHFAPDPSKVTLFDDTDPAELYVKYKPAPRLKILQQVFKMAKVPVKSAKAKGNQLSVKSIESLKTKKPRNWVDDAHSTDGGVMDF